MTAPCLYCPEELRFIAGRGWVHHQGGVYAVRCAGCRWTGAPETSPTECPACGGAVRDDHCATPDRSREARPSSPQPAAEEGTHGS